VKPRPLLKLETLSPAWTDYELLDTGSGRKLERFSSVTLIRPEPQADWRPSLPQKTWDAAQGSFVQPRHEKKGEWKFPQSVPQRWIMKRKRLSFWVQPMPSGHLGVFPDQASHWDWLDSRIEAAAAPPRVLSLFGYTGLATLAAAAAGAHVTHVDSSRKAIQWARENQTLSQLADRPIRWIVDDAQTYVARELRRGRPYDGLILDPPRFGRGPRGELWKVEDSLPALLGQCHDLLSSTPLFVLLNTYTTVLTSGQTAREAMQLETFLKEMFEGRSVTLTSGELVLTDRAKRQISNSVFTRAVVIP
jgi:23S rRNA (cytosine1962-C5)-methyltransferase